MNANFAWRHVVAAALAVIAMSASGSARLAVAQVAPDADIEFSPISGDIAKPRRHARLRDPAELSGEELAEIYRIASSALAIGYKGSGFGAAGAYQGWRRYNRYPYLSASHGNHYVNNYANEVARAYGKFEEAGTLPVGSVIAKDSFAVTSSREILLGPLFIMQKMPAGFSPVTGDWKYVQIQPDGAVLGETNGKGAERVEYCIPCHLAVEQYDHLYFVPKEYRVRLE